MRRIRRALTNRTSPLLRQLRALPSQGAWSQFVVRFAMSALGQKQTSRSEITMSALPPKADIAERDRHVDAVGRKVRRTTALGQAVSCASFA
jgi:hypothetical protein